MPQRPFTRDQTYLLPPSLDDWVSPTHPVRFIAAWLDGFDSAHWAGAALGVDLSPARQGEARYALPALLVIWVNRFMVGIRSSQALETACRDQLPFRWLSGNQTPDQQRSVAVLPAALVPVPPPVPSLRAARRRCHRGRPVPDPTRPHALSLAESAHDPAPEMMPIAGRS